MKQEYTVIVEQPGELISAITIGTLTYRACSVLDASLPPRIITRFYHDRKVVGTYGEALEMDPLELSPLLMQDEMRAHLERIIRRFLHDHVNDGMRPIDYINQARLHMKRGREAAAYSLIREAYRKFPSDALVLSWFGWLSALVRGDKKRGLELCEKALKGARKANMRDVALMYPSLYVNLGRTLLCVGDKRRAVEAFERVMQTGVPDNDLVQEMQKLGRRKRPLFPFLSRSNALNVYGGKLMYRIGLRA